MREWPGLFRMGLRTDRRGTVTVFVAVWLLAVFGVAAIGVDGGLWYLQRCQEQNAADFSALAGVDAVAAHGGTGRISGAGTLLAGVNGFTSQGGAAVMVRSPPQSGAYAGNSNAVEAVIHQKAPLGLTRLIKAFARLGPQTIGVRAVALYSAVNDNACVLSLVGNLDISGNSTVIAPSCVMASNNQGADSISVAGSATVTANSLSASGGCSGCDNATLTVPYKIDQLQVKDPFKAAQAYTFPSTPKQSFSTSMQPGYYQGIHITNGDSKGGVTFAPGLYVIGSAGMQIDGGTVTCSACTFVFTNGGTLQLNGTATINFAAQANVAGYPALDGVLFYGDVTKTARINGGSNSTFDGAVYFPNSNVEINGNAGAGAQPLSQCFVAVAQSVTFLGNNATGIAVAGCKNLNIPSMTTYYARLVE